MLWSKFAAPCAACGADGFSHPEEKFLFYERRSINYCTVLRNTEKCLADKQETALSKLKGKG
jgi:hypothetical protein